MATTEVKPETPERPSPTHATVPRAPVPPPSPRETILREAIAAVVGDRQLNYGAPEDSFQRIAGLWSAYLQSEEPLTAADVALMLALLKVARLANSPDHRDSWVDLAGYAACGAEAARSSEALQEEGP